MRVISKRRLRQFWDRFPDARGPLQAWFKVVAKARWADFADVRATFATASGIPLKCGITAIVFNISRNKYRLVTRIEYRFHVVYVKAALTHREYDTDKWKDDLCEQ